MGPGFLKAVGVPLSSLFYRNKKRHVNCMIVSIFLEAVFASCV